MKKKTAIMTDTNSGLTGREAEEMGVYLLAMPFYMDDECFMEGDDLTQETFFQRLKPDMNVYTSQPSPASLLDMWEDILKEYEEVVYIPMTSGLSTSCENAIALSADYEGRVVVVDNKRISVPMVQSIRDALWLAGQGKSALQIRQVLEETQYDSSIYIMVDTLHYLRKGGRITPAAAALGSVLHIKPVLQIQGARLDAYAKARGSRKAKRLMFEAIRQDMQTRFAELTEKGQLSLEAAYSGTRETGEKWVKEVEEEFPGMHVDAAPLSLSISCHVGPGALGVAVTRILEPQNETGTN